MVTALQMITKPMAVSKPHLSWSQLLVTASNAGHAESAIRRHVAIGVLERLEVAQTFHAEHGKPMAWAVLLKA